MVGLVQLVSNIAALFVVDKSGRKPLLTISAVLMCLSMASMGTAFYLKQNGIEQFGYVHAIFLATSQRKCNFVSFFEKKKNFL